MPRRFSIRYPPLQCSISEVRLRSGLASWEEGEPGESNIWLDSVDEAGLIMFDNWYDRPESFAILIRKLPNDSAGADIATTPTGTQSLPEVLDMFKNQMRQGLRTDRISRFLRSGVSASVALRPGTVSGEKRFLVDVSLKPTRGVLQWPSPAKGGVAQHVDHPEDRIVDQIKTYAPLRPSSYIERMTNATLAS